MKIYDCFIFYNELDLLEIRLRILDPYVDYFVIVEATKTHSGKPKNLYFKENKKRFKKWDKKIIHIIVEDMPKPGKILFKSWKVNSLLGIGRFRPEIFQRNQIKKGLKNCKAEDIILVSDLDEIPNPKKLGLMKRILEREIMATFSQKMFYYYLNGFVKDLWPGTKACTYRNFKRFFNLKAERFRRLRNLRLRLFIGLKKGMGNISEGGWHFSYLGSPKSIVNKIESISHTENDQPKFKDLMSIKKKIKEGKDLFNGNNKIRYVKIDKSFPEEIRKNKKRYSKFIKN